MPLWVFLLDYRTNSKVVCDTFTNLATMINVLFVCLGNICRSPLAEGVFQKLVEDEGLADSFQVDSCGTSAYHIGELPHQSSRKVAKKNGITLTHQARQLVSSDYQEFDYILAMDASNIRNMKLVNGFKEGEGKVSLLRTFDNQQSGSAVDDPYGGDFSDFEDCYNIVKESCQNLLAHIKQEKQL